MEFGANEQGFLTGGMSGAATGATIGSLVAPGIGTGVGAATGAAIGFIGGGLLGMSQSQSQRDAQRRAQREAENARRRSVSQEMGIRQQAENIALSGLQRATPGRRQTGVTPQGFIGQNVPTTAGTF